MLATLAARPVPRSTPAPAGPRPLAAQAVLAKYARALHAVERPSAISYVYAVEQLGLRNMEQTHRVYRSGLNERDETLIVDGYTLKRPSVRIIANRTNRYDIAAVAPKPSSYRFVYRGTVAHGGAYAYRFATAPFGGSAFAVTEIELDGARFLPLVIRFKIAGGDARGQGELAYEPNGRFWVVRDARVSAHLKGGATANEHIAWSEYSFPSGLPESTFEAPHQHAVEELVPASTPVPEAPPGP